jgi:hypothetical protein
LFKPFAELGAAIGEVSEMNTAFVLEILAILYADGRIEKLAAKRQLDRKKELRDGLTECGGFL